MKLIMLLKKLMILNKGKEAVSNYILDLFFLTVLGLLILPNLIHCNQLEVLNDEFGYWSIAAQWAGKDWHELIPSTPYYSYGYSILLVPLFWLFDNPILLYRSAIILNFCMLIIIFFVLKKICYHMFPYISPKMVSLIVFAVCLYPSVCFQVQIAWTETLLFLLFVLLAYMIMLNEEKEAIWKSIAIAIISTFSYMVHKRFVFVVVIVIFTLIYFQIKNKKISFAALLAIGISVFGILISNYISNVNINLYWQDSEASQINSTSVSLIGEYIGLFCENTDVFIKSFLGKAGYFLGVGGPVFICGLFFCVKEIYTEINSKFEKKRYGGTCFFCIGSVAVMIGISTLNFLYPERQDQIVYGRYAECVIGVILLIGIVEIIYNEKILKIVNIAIIALIISAISIDASIEQVDTLNFAYVCSPGLSGLYHDLLGGNESYFWAIALLQIVLLCLMEGMLYYKKMSKGNVAKILNIVVISCVGTVWCVMYLLTNTDQINSRIRNNNESYTLALPIIEEYENADIIYVLDPLADEFGREAKRLQYVIKDRMIHVMDINNVYELEAITLLLLEKKSTFPEGYFSDKTLVGETNNLQIYLCGETE